MRPRILILHQNMGSGHKRVASILEDMLNSSMDADIINMPANELLGSSFVRGFERFWNGVMRRDWVRFADFVGAFLFRATIVPILDAVSVSAIHNRLDELRPDAIVSTADGFNKILGAYADEKGIPFFLFTTSTSVFVDNVAPNATHLCYFRETENAIRSIDLSMTYSRRVLTRRSPNLERVRYVAGVWGDCVVRGPGSLYRNARSEVDRDNGVRCRCLGPLVEHRYFEANDRERIRAALGIDNANDSVMIACGSLGGAFVVEMLNALRHWTGAPLNLLVMCGHDGRALDAVTARAGTLGNINLRPFWFVENFHDFLAVSDCMIARPSAGVFNECLVTRVPYLAFNRAASNEKGIGVLVEKHGLGEVCRSTVDLIPALEKVLAKRERYRKNIDAFLSMYPQTYKEQRDIIVGEVRRALGAHISDSPCEAASR